MISFDDHTDSPVHRVSPVDGTGPWTNLDRGNLVPGQYLGSTSYRVAPGTFSPGLELVLDTLGDLPFSIQASAWVKGRKANIPFVISVETKEDGIIEWHAANLREQIIDRSEWNHVFQTLDRDLSIPVNNAIFKVYILNESQGDLLIDDLSVQLVCPGKGS
jgi:hypothetical protein